MNKYEILKNKFNYTEFRYGQDEIIDSIVDKEEDNLVIIPTGGGKSLIYQISGLLLKEKNKKGITLIISPLIALMQDQVKEFNKVGVAAIDLNSYTVAPSEELRKTYNGDYDFVLVSPEKLGNVAFQNFLKKIDINLFVIDEAHCASMWGHQFRPEYSQIGEIIHNVSDNPLILALTATATNETREDLKKIIFGKKNPNLHIGGFYRKNFNLNVQEISDEGNQGSALILKSKIDELKNKEKAGIVYFSTVSNLKDTIEGDEYFLSLMKSGYLGIYHGQETKENRELAQKNYLLGKTKLLFATTAFGMGVNKKDINYIIHYGYPSTVESYYQEIGRGGRDGREVETLLLTKDLNTQEFFIMCSYLSQKEFKDVLHYLRTTYIDTSSDNDNIFVENSFSEISEGSLGKKYFENGIRTLLVRYKIINNLSHDGSGFNLDKNNLDKVINNNLSELDSIRRFKLANVKKMNEFFSSVSPKGIELLLKYYPEDNYSNIEKYFSSLLYLKILNFFEDIDGIKECIKDSYGKPINYSLSEQLFIQNYLFNKGIMTNSNSHLKNSFSEPALGNKRSSLEDIASLGLF